MNHGLPDSLLLKKEGELSIYYAPLEYLNKDASLVIVGITPGLQQAVNALNQAKREIDNGLTTEEILKSAKSVASFSGSMRKNLVSMLDYMGIHNKLGINSAAELFSSQTSKVQFTSVLSHPVFYKGKNYNGTPSMINHPLLRETIDAYFMQYIKHFDDALFLSLGPKVTDALRWAVTQGALQENQLLTGLPHPSGANAERIAYFLEQKSRQALSAKTNPDSIDLHKDALFKKLQDFSFA